MFFEFIPRAYRMVLIVSALALLGFSAMSTIGNLALFAMVMGEPLSVLLHATANAFGVVLLSLVSCVFLAKKAKKLKSSSSLSTIALIAQVMSITGFFLAIPWLYHAMTASYSWRQHTRYGLDAPFAFWVYLLAAGIILHEISQMQPFKGEMKRMAKSNKPEIISPNSPQVGGDKDTLFP